MYEVAKHWYTKFIPELKEIDEETKHSDAPAKVEGAKKLAAAVDELLARPEHAWYTGNLSPEEREKRRKAQEEFKARYGQED